jgi:DNA-binding CsgD family transcriptional regulator
MQQWIWMEESPRASNARLPDARRRMGRVAAGGTVIDPEVIVQLLGRRRAGGPLEKLTPREREVLGFMAEGRSNTAIARRLVVTEGAVEKHISNIFMKLELAPAEEDHRRVLAVLAQLATADSSCPQEPKASSSPSTNSAVTALRRRRRLGWTSFIPSRLVAMTPGEFAWEPSPRGLGGFAGLGRRPSGADTLDQSA